MRGGGRPRWGEALLAARDGDASSRQRCRTHWHLGLPLHAVHLGPGVGRGRRIGAARLGCSYILAAVNEGLPQLVFVRRHGSLDLGQELESGSIFRADAMIAAIGLKLVAELADVADQLEKVGQFPVAWKDGELASLPTAPCHNITLPGVPNEMQIYLLWNSRLSLPCVVECNNVPGGIEVAVSHD